MTTHHIVSLLDVDDTLYNNDQVEADLKLHLAHMFGSACRDRYWQIYEQLRVQEGYADYLGALEHFRLELPHDPRVLTLSSFLLEYPFATRLYPGALDAIRHLQRWGMVVIVSDGDAVYQPRKIEQSGLLHAVHGHMLIFVHKEQQLADIERLYPAEHYLLIDDKLPILTAIKEQWRERVTTIWVQQGHYAKDQQHTTLPPADITLQQIGDLVSYDRSRLLGEARVL
jgi:FMN phosphatase YigB (HAD superfamily)